MLCATDLETNSQLNSDFSALLSKPARLPGEDTLLYTMAREIITTAGLDVSAIEKVDQLRIAAALVAVERQG